MTTSPPIGPPRSEARRVTPKPAGAGLVAHRVGRFGLLALLALVMIGFSLAEPEAFMTWSNVKFTLDQQTLVVIGGLAVMIPLLTDSIDLSVAANISLANIVLAASTTDDGFSTPVGVVLAVLASAVVGLVNGLIVEKLQVQSFVATLGMATVLSGLGLAYTNGQDILTVPSAVTSMIRTEVLGLPLSVFYGVVCMVVVALVLRYLPVGRKLRAVGANPRAAALTGIRPGLYRIVSFAVGGALAGVAGVVLTGQLASATASGAANSTLLPIFAAVFLGATAFTPGRHNVLGLFTAALFLSFVSSGLVLVGAPLWASPIINGGVLILAVALSAWAGRMKASQLRNEQLRQLDEDDDRSATAVAPA